MKFTTTTVVALLSASAFAAPSDSKACVAKPAHDNGVRTGKWGDSVVQYKEEPKAKEPAPKEPAQKDPSEYWGDSSAPSKGDDGKKYIEGHKEKFTSTWSVVGTPDQVVLANGTAAPGEKTSRGYYNFGINSDKDLICWYILLTGTTGPYQSPALTATHIHEAVRGLGGPPRVVFPDPEPANSGPEVDKVSKGCMTGPFLTGVLNDDDVDQGVGFKLKEIEEDPKGYYCDVHTTKWVPGANRGQFA